MNNSQAKVKRALEHVRQFYPQVVMVVYSCDQRWLFMDEDFAAPTFDGRINVSILEEAADSVAAPAVFDIRCLP